MNLSQPDVSVIMPCYNGATTVRASLDSILAQKKVNFELIVVDDASTDGTLEILRDIDDSRVRIIALPENVGLATALDIGIAESKSDLIARQDQDDFSRADRLVRQFSYMTQHPGTVLLGTWAELARANQEGTFERVGAHKHPVDDDVLRIRLLWSNPFVHSSVMFRRSAWEESGGYAYSNTFPEDYSLWSRMIALGHVSNVPEFLVTYFERPGSMSRSARGQLEQGVVTISMANITKVIGKHDGALLGGAPAEVLNGFASPPRALSDVAKFTSSFWRLTGRANPDGNLRILRVRIRSTLSLMIGLLTGRRSRT